MNIIFYHPFFEAKQWLSGLQSRLPTANIRQWRRGDTQPADYALVWQPPQEMLASRVELKGVFALGAGGGRYIGSRAASSRNITCWRAIGAAGRYRDVFADAGICRGNRITLFPSYG